MPNKLLRKDIEYIVHCEKDGTVIGPISKKHAHTEGVRAVLTHYSTWSMVFNPASGKYGIQQKNPKKHDKYGAGKWDMGAAGHNPYVEKKDSYTYLDFDDNLVKETSEEIGLDIKMYKELNKFLKASKILKNQPIGYIFDKFHYKTKISNEFVGLGFILTPTTKLEFKDDEVIDFKWLTPKELKEFLKVKNEYCAPLPLVFEKAEKFRKKYLI